MAMKETSKAQLNLSIADRIKAAASRHEGGLEGLYRDLDRLNLPPGEGCSGRAARDVCNLVRPPNTLLLMVVGELLGVYPGLLLAGDPPTGGRVEVPDPVECGMEGLDSDVQRRLWAVSQRIWQSRRFSRSDSVEKRLAAMTEIARSLAALIRLPCETVFFEGSPSPDYCSAMMYALEELPIKPGPPDDSLLKELRSWVIAGTSGRGEPETYGHRQAHGIESLSAKPVPAAVEEIDRGEKANETSRVRRKERLKELDS